MVLGITLYSFNYDHYLFAMNVHLSQSCIAEKLIPVYPVTKVTAPHIGWER